MWPETVSDVDCPAGASALWLRAPEWGDNDIRAAYPHDLVP